MKLSPDMLDFKTAKLAQKKGFCLGTIGSHVYNYFEHDGRLGYISWGHLHLKDPAYVPQTFLQHWLREEKKVYAYVTPIFDKFLRLHYKCHLLDKNGANCFPDTLQSEYITHEHALKIVLREALKILP